MNHQEFIKLKQDLAKLETIVKSVESTVNGFRIDQRRVLNANSEIAPGIFTKIAFDMNGLVLRGMGLEESDIPELSIDKIKGLRRLLESKADASSVKSSLTKEELSLLSQKREIAAGVGTKVQWDEDGLIVGASELLVNDLPSLPVTKIEGLEARLEILEARPSDDTFVEEITPINPGIFPKISYDHQGRVIGGFNLSIDDIPKTLLNQVNTIETRLISFASQETVNGLINETRRKVDALPGFISAGTYTKLRVNKNGLVEGGGVLSLQDLPVININDIPELDGLLRRKAEQSDLVNLMNTVTSLMSDTTKGDIQLIKTQLKGKMEATEAVKINEKLATLSTSLEAITNGFSNEVIMKELRSIKETLSTLAGEVTVLQKRMGMESSFCTIQEGEVGE